MRNFDDKKRIVVKIGSSSLFYPETKKLNYTKLEKLVRLLSDIQNRGKEVVLVSSGAIATGRNMLGFDKNLSMPERQALASIGQARLIATYQKLFSEYDKIASQILITKFSFHSKAPRENAKNTLLELFKMGAIPIVNENDTVTTFEIEFGDNDSLSALVAKLVDADLLILLSDIDGLYDDDPSINPDAKLIEEVDKLDEEIFGMGKSTSKSEFGTGGMSSKLEAAKIAVGSKIDMVIANSNDLDNIDRILNNENVGTYFKAQDEATYNFEEFNIED